MTAHITFLFTLSCAAGAGFYNLVTFTCRLVGGAGRGLRNCSSSKAIRTKQRSWWDSAVVSAKSGINLLTVLLRTSGGELIPNKKIHLRLRSTKMQSKICLTLTNLMILISCAWCSVPLYPYGPGTEDKSLVNSADPAVTLTLSESCMFFGEEYTHICVSCTYYSYDI